MSTGTEQRLRDHMKVLTVDIGERSVRVMKNIERTQKYIEAFYSGIGLPVRTEPYPYRESTVANVIAQLDFCEHPSKCFLLGAHYDSVEGTVGADDNAGAIAVQLETARRLKALSGNRKLDLCVKFVSFALEERPVFGTNRMGSRVYARKARKENERIDGMVCLEMVGYTCDKPGCQGYPFPLGFMDYPKTGSFIGIVGDLGSIKLTRSVTKAFKQNPSLPVVSLNVPFRGWLMPSVRLSDHAPFWDEGFEAVMVTDTAFYRNPYYHLPSDTMDKLDFRFMAELVESLVLFFSSL